MKSWGGGRRSSVQVLLLSCCVLSIPSSSTQPSCFLTLLFVSRKKHGVGKQKRRQNFGLTFIVSVEITNKMQPCNRIYYSTVHWRLNVFRAAYRSSSGALTVFAASGLHKNVVTGRSPHAYVNQRLQIQLELLMMSGIPIETCWAFNERWNNKFYYKVASCWLFLLGHTTMHGSMNIKFIVSKILNKLSVYVRPAQNCVMNLIIMYNACCHRRPITLQCNFATMLYRVGHEKVARDRSIT